MGEVAEELARPLERPGRAGRDDLRELEELDHRLALGDALRAERHVDVETESGHELLDQRGHARVDGAAQHEELTVEEVRRDVGDGGGHRVEVGVEVLVDRGPDHDHDVLGVADHVG